MSSTAVRRETVYRVEAFNTARESENKMHSDDVAAQYGFRGGLVPGVDVYAYMTQPAVAKWGLDWLKGGALRARFLKPVYDGDEAVVTAVEGEDGTLDLTVASLGELCATGAAHAPGAAGPVPDLRAFPAAPLPTERLPAVPESLPPGDPLGTWELDFSASASEEYLDNIRERLPVYRAERIAHPAQLLRQANMVLRENIRLGPWIHVESHARYFGVVRDGDTMSTRARVLETTERKGHKFVTLDVVVTANGCAPVMRATHIAIYEPRRNRE